MWYAILGGVDGDLWVRGDSELYRHRLGAEKFENLPGLPATTNAIPTLGLDPEERLLVPTDDGLALQTKNGWEIITVNDSLGGSDIATVVKDQEGSIWLGLMGSGLTRWLGYGEWQSWTEKEGLSRSTVWSLAKDRDGKLWVGTRFGLNYADTHKDKIEWKQQRVNGVEWARSVAPAADGSLWIAADAAGVVRLNPKSGQTRSYELAPKTRVEAGARTGGQAAACVGFEQAGPIPGNSRCTGRSKVRAVETRGYRRRRAIRFGRGRFVRPSVVCGDYGLIRFTGEKSRRFTEADGLRTNGVAQAAPSPDGHSIWVGYQDAFGLTRLTFTTDKVRAEHWSATSTSGLRSDKTVFLGLRQAGTVVGRNGSRRGRVRPDAVASPGSRRRLDLGRLQHAGVSRQ